MNKVKALVIFTVFVDVLGLAIVIPVLPFYIQSFGGTALTSAALFAVYALCSFLSAPFLGSLSDRVGRKPVLIASIISTAIGWMVFATAKSIPVLFIGRIIDGLAAGNISTAQSALVDIAKDDKERAANLGLIGMLFGIGFILGPLLGGVLTHVSSSLPFWIVGAMSLINSVLAIIFFPETNHHRNTAPLKMNPLAPIGKAIRNTTLLPSFAVWLLFGLAATGMHTVFSWFLQQTYNFNSLIIGLFLAAVGAMIAFNQAVGMKRFWLKKFTEPQLEFGMIAMFGLSFVLMAVPVLPIFILGLIAMTFANGVLQVVVTSQTIGAADPKTKGEVVGILTAITSISAVIAPLIAGKLFEVKTYIPFLISTAYMAVAFGIVLINRKKMTKMSAPEEEIVPPVI